MGKLRKNIFVSLLLLVAIIFTGMAGYRIFGGSEWTSFDAFYQTLIALQMVTFEEVHELTHPAARIFNLFLYLAALGVILYAGTNLASFVLEGTLTDILKKERIKRMIQKLRDHFIVCGAGATGEPVVEELVRTNMPVVVIDKDPERITELRTKYKDLLVIEGDATHDEVLEEAGVGHAKGLIAALSSDKDNLYAVITARHLNPNARIISKGEDPKCEQKLRKGGADAVVYAYKVGGMRLVSEAIRPSVVTFLDTMLRDNAKVFRLQEISIPENSHLIDKKLQDIPYSDRAALLVAIKKFDGSYVFNPVRGYTLGKEDILIFMGEVAAIRKMEQKIGRV